MAGGAGREGGVLSCSDGFVDIFDSVADDEVTEDVCGATEVLLIFPRLVDVACRFETGIRTSPRKSNNKDKN